MWTFRFEREIKTNEEMLLNNLGAYLFSQKRISLQIIKNGAFIWQFSLPDTVSRLPSFVEMLGEKKTETLDFVPRFWIQRPLLLDNRSAILSGSKIACINDFPIEEIIQQEDNFILQINLEESTKVPFSRVETLIPITISTNSHHLAKTIEQIFTGYISDKEKETFAYTSEIKYLIRPPIATYSYNNTGTIQPIKSINTIFANDQSLLTKHCLICGQTGSGKTNTAKIILDEVVNNFSGHLMLLDNKGEYSNWAHKNSVPYYEVGLHPQTLSLLGVNPFIPGRQVKLINHLETLSMVLSVSGFTGAGRVLPEYMKLMLFHFFMDFWKVKEDRLFDLLNLSGNELIDLGYPFWGVNGETVPQLISRFWNRFLVTGFDQLFGSASGKSLGDLKGTLAARFSALAYSPLNYFSYQKSAAPPDSFLEHSYVLSFHGISQSNLVLLTSMLAFLFCESAQMQPETQSLKNIMLIEEAHLILKRDSTSGEVVTAEMLLGDIFERMLAELRSRGVGIVLVDQSPSRLVRNVISNTGCKIVHRLMDSEDIQEMGDSIGLSEINEFQFLPLGTCFQKIEDLPPQKEVINCWKS
jgi:hypothetical protein